MPLHLKERKCTVTDDGILGDFFISSMVVSMLTSFSAANIVDSCKSEKKMLFLKQ